MAAEGVSGKRGVWVVGVVGLVCVSLVSWWLGGRAQSPEQAAARASEPAASWITVGVERRVLASTVVGRGDVRAEVSAVVRVPSSVEGVAVVTRVPPVAGSDVLAGQVVVEVSGRPVFVLPGDVPVYRTLRPGMSGADVVQLQTALSGLGFVPDSDGVFGAGTKQAVTDFYAAAGFEVVLSETTAADVAAAEQAFNAATSALTAAESALATAQSGGSGAGVAAAQAGLNAAYRALEEAKAAKAESVTNAQAALVAAQNEYNTVMADPNASQADRDAANVALVQAQTAVSAAVRQGDAGIAAANDQVRVASLQLAEAKKAIDVPAAQAARDQAVAARDSAAVAFMSVVASTGPTVPLGEMVFVPTMPARVQSAVTTVGPLDNTVDESGGSDGSTLVRLAAGGLVVSSTIRAGDEGLVRVGMPVELLDETTNTTYPASIVSIADTPVTDSSGQLGRPAVIVPDEALPAELAGVNVRVVITASASDGEVLVVPLAAVSSGADGTTRVSILEADSADPVDVEVTIGISADGFIAVEPVTAGGLVEGDLVVVGR